MKIKSILISGEVSSNSIEAQNLFSIQRFGEKLEEKIIYSLPEAFFLFQEKKMEIYNQKNKLLQEKEILKNFLKFDKNFNIRYKVFKDLRKKGYIVKTALKFGAEFRIYDKGDKVGKSHSKWICFPVSENSKSTWHEFSSKNRVAHSTKKNLLITIVDEEGQVSYFEVKWMKL